MSNKQLRVVSTVDGFNIYECEGDTEKLIAFMPNQQMLTQFLAKKELVEAFGKDAIVFID